MSETNRAGYAGTAAGGTEAMSGRKIPSLGQDSRGSAKAALEAMVDEYGDPLGIGD